MNLQEMIGDTNKRIVDFTAAHQTSIEVGLSWAMFGAAALAAWFSAPKAKQELEDKKKELNTDNLPLPQKALIIGKHATPSAISFIAGIILNKDAVGTLEKNLVTTTAVAEMWRAHAIDYREAARRVVGEKKEQKIVDDMNAKEVAENPPVTNVNIFAPKEDGIHRVLIKDTYTKRFFWERRELVEIAIANAYKLQDAYDQLSAYDWLTQLPADSQEQIFKGMDDNDMDEFMNVGWNPTTGHRFHVELISPLGAVPSGEWAGYPYLELSYEELPFCNF